MRIRRAFVFLTIGLVYSPLQAAALEILVVNDQPYRDGGAAAERKQCKLDLYLPRQHAGFPVLVWFHGGGLMGGDKAGEIEVALGRRFAAEGIAVASVGYRLHPQVSYPTYIEDCAAAVAWVARNVADHGGNPRALFVGGFSAGGYLTAMLALDDRYLTEEALSARDVRGYIPISGQLDTHSTVRKERGVRGVLEILDDSAPLFHVDKSAPPQLVIIGEAEDEHRMKMNRLYAKRLRATGNTRTTYLTVPDRTHRTIATHLEQENDKVATAMLKFIRDHLPDSVRPEQIGQILPIHSCGDVYLAGQPQPDDLKLLSERGVKTVITLRADGEVPWDEAAAVRAHGMEFVHIPFRGPEELTPQVFEGVLTILRDKERGPTMLHCGSSNRVGAIWYVHRVLDDKLSPEEALAEAKQIGLRTPGYLDKAREYVEQAEKSADLKSASPGE